MTKVEAKTASLKDILLVKEKALASQDKLNALVSFYDDLESQYQTNTNTNSPLYQMPIVLKDNISTKGVKTTASSNILDNYIPTFDATVVTKLKAAGAIFIGKSSMDELGMGGTNLSAHTGPVYNPYDLTRIAGGSSGGSAAVVAAGIVPLAIGTDTGDSIRKPAAFCGIVGFKPTYGRISRYGVIPYASSLDHVGYFTRNVQDAASALEVLAGRDDYDMTSSFLPVEQYSQMLQGDLQGKKIAILKNVVDVITNQDIIQQFNDLTTKIKKQGAITVEVEIPKQLAQAMLVVYNVISNCEASANHANLDGLRFGKQQAGNTVETVMINSRTKGLSFSTRQRLITGEFSLMGKNQTEIFQKAQKVRRLICMEIENILKSYDVLIAPASGMIAPTIDEAKNQSLSTEELIVENHMVIGNFTGYPSITLPLGFHQGLPLGVNITGRPFKEGQLLDISQAIENISGLKDIKKEVV